ncbi:MAG: bifunctional riboflavin kinase/FAD synthetase [Oceanospirillaceae bacterium]|nr:bifunctional riboflavin kinase/FAD synthetase [Oceanospirillaceae bacterium]
MELIRGLHNLRDNHRVCVATIGNFDGVHRGHVKVLEQVKAKGRELGLPTVAIIFEPQPREFFAGKDAPPRLTRFDEKVRLLRDQCLDRVLCLPFNDRLRNMSAASFIEELLLEGLAVRHFVVGDDFRFGCDRIGDYAMLQQVGKDKGFSVEHMKTYLLDGERVSSTRVREALQANELDLAERLLGWRYRICGRVMHGQKLGRTLGVPTANVRMHRFAAPLRGVYAVRVSRAGDDTRYPGVANIGMRPTVHGTQPVLEAHLFDFKGDLYGQLLSVEFVAFVRDERRFEGLEQLKQQIQQDIDAARALLA